MKVVHVQKWWRALAMALVCACLGMVYGVSTTNAYDTEGPDIGSRAISVGP